MFELIFRIENVKYLIMNPLKCSHLSCPSHLLILWILFLSSWHHCRCSQGYLHHTTFFFLLCISKPQNSIKYIRRRYQSWWVSAKILEADLYTGVDRICQWQRNRVKTFSTTQTKLWTFHNHKADINFSLVPKSFYTDHYNCNIFMYRYHLLSLPTHTLDNIV